ncbi:uncharacterized protein ISCGN_001628 [Ixodes scapularis]
MLSHLQHSHRSQSEAILLGEKLSGLVSRTEAQFHLRRIRSQTARYYHVVSALPPEVADELDDVLASPPPHDAYDYIKRTILAGKTESEASRLQQLLNTEELGDRRPSQLLHRMRQLLGASFGREESDSTGIVSPALATTHSHDACSSR